MSKHSYLLLFSIVSLSCGLSQAAPRPFRVVIDPGHGGQDYGAVYDNGKLRVAEKDITLALAHEAAAKLREDGFDVILTREKDREVPLAARTALANRLKADIFLSIHMNSTHTPMVSDAHGVETYILNNTTDASSRRLAELENTVLTAQEDDDLTQGTDIALILKDLRLDANLSESKTLACAIQNQLVAAVPPQNRRRQDPKRNRGVKQALFHVLLGADMPSALLEAGFITSPEDRNLMLSQNGQRAVGTAIAAAIEQYRLSKAGNRVPAALSRCKVN